jgi:hypothetical protein
MVMRNWCFGGSVVCFIFAFILMSEVLATTGTVWICTGFILDAIHRPSAGGQQP